MNRLFLYAFVSGLVAQAVAVDYKICEDYTSDVTSIDVAGCPGKGDCVLNSDQMLILTVELTARENSTILEAEGTTKFEGIVQEIVDFERDGCKNVVSCPVIEGRNYTYKPDPIDLSYFPDNEEIEFQFQLRGTKAYFFACFQFIVTLQ